MEQITRDGLVYYRFGELGNVTHGIFTRQGGESRAPFDSLNLGGNVGDDPKSVRRNHERMYATLGVEDGRACTVWQVHSADVVIANPGISMGIDTADLRNYFADVTNGEADPSGAALPRDAQGRVDGRPSAAGYDRAIIRVEVRNVGTNGYRSLDPATGANPSFLNPLTGAVWGAQDPCVTHPAQNPQCVDDGYLGGPVANGLVFGGALPWEANNLSFSTMASSKSWQISPALADIQAVMNEIGAEKTVLSVYFRQPYVLDDASGLKDAGAIVAGFGVSNTALLDVLTGKILATGTSIAPQGKLPFALAKNLQAVIDNDPDAPGYPEADTLYPFGFGLSY